MKLNSNLDLKPSVLLITPPFTQLNTPYPATAYIKGFLNTQGYISHQADLGLEVILALFSTQGLKAAFEVAERKNNLSENCQRIVRLKSDYLNSIEPVIRFLQHKNPTLAYSICEGRFLPQAKRFEQLDDLDWAFGSLGVQDKARHLATLYLEDLADLIKEAVDENFGFSRYAERLGRSATSFDGLNHTLDTPPSFIDGLLLQILEQKIQSTQPDLVCLSIPFPGNLYGGLRCGQYIKKHYPNIKLALGGGYANTELRSISDERVFNYIDFITLDDGERPLHNLLDFLEGKREQSFLKRTFLRENHKVVYINGSKESDVPFSQVGTPDYEDLPLDKYLSVIEVANPMHRLWSDGRWNKLTMAHGCYWKKCSFCDISLDYIRNYEPISASLICDRIEELIKQTGETGFHFVDEAAPPALMREVALEIIRRNLKISWWTNIRFEQRFTADLCLLLKASGCIAVSGGLEVASDRLLVKMQKGVTVTQVAQVARNFTQSGIMVHAYLMYGFPTQTEQETIDSLEMVRQLFMTGVLQSGFWHLFAMTAHSPVGLDAKAFGVIRKGPEEGSFANNDLYHSDPDGADHEIFSEGLKKALFNYMHGLGYEFPLQKWFDFTIPRTTVSKNFIEKALMMEEDTYKDNFKPIWLGKSIRLGKFEKNKKGIILNQYQLVIDDLEGSKTIPILEKQGLWFCEELPKLSLHTAEKISWAQFQEKYRAAGLGEINHLLDTDLWLGLQEAGLLVV